MKVCIIGSSGHYGYALNGIRGQEDIIIQGISAGSTGESIDILYKSVTENGYLPKVYDDYKVMLDEIKPEIAVINCFFGDQAKVTVEALKRKIHVFVEKPISTTLGGLEDIKIEYSKAGVYLAAMFGIRYEPWFLTAKKVIEEGAIGTVRLMNSQKSYKLGIRGDHYKTRETYGGTIPWVGSHAIDWMRWLGGEEMKSVYASHSTMYNHNNGELEMSALCHFTFSNEVFGSSNIDYLRPQIAKSHDDDRIRIAGTHGVIEVRDKKVYLINGINDGMVELPLVPKGEIFTDFLNQVRDGKKCMVTAEDSFIITDASLKARISADEKKIIYFE